MANGNKRCVHGRENVPCHCDLNGFERATMRTEPTNPQYPPWASMDDYDLIEFNDWAKAALVKRWEIGRALYSSVTLGFQGDPLEHLGRGNIRRAGLHLDTKAQDQRDFGL